MTAVELVIGLALLLGGGEALVRGSVAVAMRLGVSPLLIGLTLVGFGTSTPELVASLKAALMGSPGIAVGNIVGSNIANILLILGISALILPMATSPQAFRRDGVVLFVPAALLVAVVLVGYLGRPAGALFVAALAAYTLYTFFTERRTHGANARVHEAEAAEVAPRNLALVPAIAFTVGGIAGVVIGAGFLVEAAIVIASTAGLSETVIGLTLVAVGTSLPELVTSVMAAIRRHGDVAFGNIVGSNIFNILGIGGVTALVAPIGVPRLSRGEGLVFLAAYGAYLAVQLSPAMRSLLGLG